ncbi:MAG: pyridoxal phosphate-dependent aminotransferase, partial [Alphaproteobacteria bacterium]
MTVKISSRGRQVSPFIVMEVLRQANRRAVSGKDVLHLELGQPSEGPPAPVLAAAARALES